MTPQTTDIRVIHGHAYDFGKLRAMLTEAYRCACEAEIGPCPSCVAESGPPYEVSPEVAQEVEE